MIKKIVSTLSFATLLFFLMPSVSGFAESSLIISDFTVTSSTGGLTFDPSPKGKNENLLINYTLNEKADALEVAIKNPDGDLLKTFVANLSQKQSGTFIWDGIYANKLVDPGLYTVVLSANKTGETNVSDSESFQVIYSNSSAPEITDFAVEPSSFDPDFDEALISFINSEEAYIIVEIQNYDGLLINDYSSYEHNFFNSDEYHSLVWDGNDYNDKEIALGTYYVYVRLENDYGVDVERKTVKIDNSGGSSSDENIHIDGISLSPSSTFEPANDDELEIEFDIEKDLDELQILMVRGGEEIEIFDEEDVDEESNMAVYWDGTDEDDDYVAQGTWKVLFKSKVGTQVLEASKSINVYYEKPLIDELEISKEKFDNDLDEFTNIMFRIDNDSVVDIIVMEGGDDDYEIVEDMEVEKDKWYAVEWDGDNYDYDDDVDIKIIARNLVNDDVYDTKKVSVDLAEDEVSSNKSNVTNDYISPVITDGDEDMTLYYELADDADVTVTIHKGTSSSGSQVIELVDILDQPAGSHSILWDGRSKSGSKLSKGFYTYKIVSKLSTSETETGLFIVGTVGEIDGDSGSSSSSSSTSSSNISSNVVVDGISSSNSSWNNGDSSYCAGFYDVTASSSYCDAITWAKNDGIFLGYNDGTFRPYQPINRVEVLKVVLEAMDVNTAYSYAVSSFSDIDTGAWYMSYVNTGVLLGIFNGDAGKTTARPSETVNRVEALKLAFETLRVAKGYSVSTCGYGESYLDTVFGDWYYKYSCESKEYGLFDGLYLSPASLATRGEIAEMLYRLSLAGLL